MSRTIRRLQQMSVIDGVKQGPAKVTSLTSSRKKCCGALSGVSEGLGN